MPLFDYEDEITDAPPRSKKRGRKPARLQPAGRPRKSRRWLWLIMLLAVIAAALFVFGDI